MRRFVTFLLILLILLPSVLAEAPTEAPRLVDRINKTNVEDSFHFADDAKLLEMVFPQIYDCDAMLLRCGGETILVDCASKNQASRVIRMLRQVGVEKIDRVINTHPHYDHIQGFSELAKVFPIGEIYIAFPKDETKHMDDVLTACAIHNIPVKTYGDGDTFTLGEAVLTAWMKADDTWSLNERSAVIHLSYNEASALLTADIGLKTQLRLIDVIDPSLMDIDILKYPHHGKSPLSDPFIEAISMLFSVIPNNRKAQEGVYCLGLNRIPFALTVPGCVRLRTDGVTWVVDRVEEDTAGHQ